MRFSAKQYAQALFVSLQETDPSQVDLVLDNFTQILRANNDLSKFKEIEEEFEKLDLESKGMKMAKVTSAHELSPKNEAEIIKKLNKIAKSDVKLKKEIDKKILGGVLIRLDDNLIDGSVKGFLTKFKEHLSENGQ